MASLDKERALMLSRKIISSSRDLPEEAEDFAVNVREKAESINQFIQKNDYVTPKQIQALENMMEGVDRWFDS